MLAALNQDERNVTNDLLTELKTKNILLVGLGVTGLSCARFFTQHNIEYGVVDSRTQPTAFAQLTEINPDVKVQLGKFADNDFVDIDILVVSPGVSLQEPAIQKALASGAKITGDVDLFCQLVNAPIVAITGSNGKSTLTQLIGDMINSTAQSALIGGNIGVPVLDLLDRPEPDYYVLELSSFQLETTEHLADHVACILNITEDHMDRYASFEEYVQAKQKILTSAKNIIINVDDEVINKLIDNVPAGKLIAISGTSSGADFYLANEQDKNEKFTTLNNTQGVILDSRDIAITGTHNYFNILMALAVADVLGLQQQELLPTIKSYAGLPHRCEVVARINGVTWVNDSKATNTGATIAALNGFRDQSIILLLGGQAKGQSFEILNATLFDNVKQIIVYGEDRKTIIDSLSDKNDIVECKNLHAATTLAGACATSGDVVLLSPACASFDEFASYVQRGEMFAQYAQEAGVAQ